MKNNFNFIYFLLFIVAVFQIGCSSQQEKDYSKLKKLEKELFADQNNLNDSLAKELIKLSDAYAIAYKGDSKVPEIVFKSAEISTAIGMYDHAIRSFQKVYLSYPKFNKAPESLFLCGFIYDSNLMNPTKAKYYYDTFLLKYPNHILAKDAKACIANLGKSTDELVKQFQEQ